MGDERRQAEQERWNRLEKHMVAQTIHGEYTGKRLEAMEKSLGGTNVLELRDRVSDHSTTLNKGKGVIAAILILWSTVKGWAFVKGWLN